jgi:hypothetical protein
LHWVNDHPDDQQCCDNCSSPSHACHPPIQCSGYLFTAGGTGRSNPVSIGGGIFVPHQPALGLFICNYRVWQSMSATSTCEVQNYSLRQRFLRIYSTQNLPPLSQDGSAFLVFINFPSVAWAVGLKLTWLFQDNQSGKKTRARKTMPERRKAVIHRWNHCL